MSTALIEAQYVKRCVGWLLNLRPAPPLLRIVLVAWASRRARSAHVPTLSPSVCPSVRAALALSALSAVADSPPRPALVRAHCAGCVGISTCAQGARADAVPFYVPLCACGARALRPVGCG